MLSPIPSFIINQKSRKTTTGGSGKWVLLFFISATLILGGVELYLYSIFNKKTAPPKAIILTPAQIEYALTAVSNEPPQILTKKQLKDALEATSNEKPIILTHEQIKRALTE